ncbi:MAG: hypothetical protein ACOCVR_04630, partial [Myxococcota bacterium]
MREKQRLCGLLVVSALAMLVGQACGGDNGSEENGENGNGEEQPARLEVTLQGTVQKGPFVADSSVQVSLLDQALNAGDESQSAKTDSDLGDYSASLETEGAVHVSGAGYHFDEVSGRRSTMTLTLNALYEPTAAGSHEVNVNVLTHILTPRIRSLVAGGASFSEASSQ